MCTQFAISPSKRFDSYDFGSEGGYILKGSKETPSVVKVG